MTALTELTPQQAAQQLVAQQDDAAWLSSFAEELDRHLGSEQLARVVSLWRLSRAELGRLFGVSRQAVTKWLREGVPVDRSDDVADLAAMTDLLVRYVKRDRISAVVRRPAPNLAGRSLLDLVAAGRIRDAREATQRMFAFGDIHG